MFEFNLTTSDKAQKEIVEVGKKIDDTKPALIKVGLIMIRSIDKNFRAQGRPRKWYLLSPMTIGLRRSKQKATIKILQDTGRLKGSITSQAHKDHVKVGTSLEKAPLLHFGGRTEPKTLKIKQHKRKITKAFGKVISPKTITVRAHDMRIGAKQVPARPFVLFQKEDVETINKLFLGHIEEATKA